MLKYTDLPADELAGIEKTLEPTRPLYLVTSLVTGVTGIADELGGSNEFGDAEWDLIVKGLHPEFDCHLVDITVH